MTSLPAAAVLRSDVRVIGLIGFAHATSHFFHLLLPPLFPWLMPEFGLSFTQAGAMMTVFFVVSAAGQALSGFVVDRIGPRRVLLAGIACFVLAALLLGAANGYAMLPDGVVFVAFQSPLFPETLTYRGAGRRHAHNPARR